MMQRIAVPVLVIAVLVGVAAVILLLRDDDDGGKPVPFEAIEIESEPAGSWSPEGWVPCVFQAGLAVDRSLLVGQSFFTVIRDQSDWQRLWDYALERGRAHAGSSCDEIGDLPRLGVDFDNEMVIAVIEQYPSSGYSLDLNQVLSGSGGWTVHTTRTTPNLNCGVYDTIEYHHEFVRVTRTDLPVELFVREVTYDCDDLANSPGLS